MDRSDVHDRWAARGGAYSPAYYAYYGPSETSDVIRRTLDRVVDRDANVLELGCSSGRHLAHLHEHGYQNLYGVDINDEAFDVMADTYPDLADAGTFYQAPLEDVVRDAPDGRFDAVYSVETLQHVHPDVEWIFDELGRLTTSLLITAEIDACDATDGADRESTTREIRHVDGVPLYVRDWSQVFTDLEWAELETDTTPVDRHTISAFRPPE